MTAPISASLQLIGIGTAILKQNLLFSKIFLKNTAPLGISCCIISPNIKGESWHCVDGSNSRK